MEEWLKISHLTSDFPLLRGVGEHRIRAEAIPKGVVDYIRERMLV